MIETLTIVEPPGSPERTAWSGVRTILVPPDIVAVRRVSPVRVKKRTLWRQRPDGERIERAGGREWLSDRLFVEAPTRQTRAVYGTSMTAHASCMIGLIVLLVAQSEKVPLAKVGSSLVMPAMLSTMPVPDVTLPAPRSREQSPPKRVPQPAAPAASEAISDSAATPVEAPSGIEPEAAALEASPLGGIDGGVEGGAGSGIAGGAVAGAPASGGLTAGPVRLTAGIDPPRKIKDVKPIYPQGALPDQARGIVVIEAVVGIDGKVHDAKVIRSIPLLDQAALDAVRQWEFVPSRVDGAPVAVILTVVVQFAIH